MHRELLEARERAIDGWYLYLSEQEQTREDRLDQYFTHHLPGWLISGIEQKFASFPRRVVTME